MSRKSGFLQRYWKPVTLTGAGGTAVTLWFEEIILFVQEIWAVIFLPILAGLIYLLDILMFKERMPKREDLGNSKTKGNHS